MEEKAKYLLTMAEVELKEGNYDKALGLYFVLSRTSSRLVTKLVFQLVCVVRQQQIHL